MLEWLKALLPVLAPVLAKLSKVKKGPDVADLPPPPPAGVQVTVPKPPPLPRDCCPGPR